MNNEYFVTDEWNDKKTKEEANVILINHLQSQLDILESRLSNYGSDTPKIYDDIYEPNTMTLGRLKKVGFIIYLARSVTSVVATKFK